MNTRQKTFATVLASIIAMSSAHSFAETHNKQPESQRSAKIASLSQAKIDAAQAIAAAKQTISGRATDVSFKHKQGRSYYEVDMVAGSQKHELRIDAQTGQVISNRAERKQAKVVPATGISLEQAVAIASKHGQVKSAELDNDHGRLTYDVSIYANAQERDLKIDANNGTVLSNRLDD